MRRERKEMIKPTPSKLILFSVSMVMDLFEIDHFPNPTVYMTSLVLLEDLNEQEW